MYLQVLSSATGTSYGTKNGIEIKVLTLKMIVAQSSFHVKPRSLKYKNKNKIRTIV